MSNSSTFLSSLLTRDCKSSRLTSPELAAARKAIGTLRGKGGKTAERAAAELEGLLADTELLEFYRASLLET